MGELFKVLAVRSPHASARRRPSSRTRRCRRPSPPIASPPCPASRHGFFTRHGGVSQGGYASLNCGLGSKDDPAAVRENRARVARLPVGARASSPRTRCTARPPSSSSDAWSREERPRADAIVTATPASRVGVLTADCAPVLFADPEASVVAAAHAGWRGAIGGVLEATARGHGAAGRQTARIVAAVGPCIGQPPTRSASTSSRSSWSAIRGSARFFSRPSRRARARISTCPAMSRIACRGPGLAADASLRRALIPRRSDFFSYRRSRPEKSPITAAKSPPSS